MSESEIGRRERLWPKRLGRRSCLAAGGWCERPVERLGKHAGHLRRGLLPDHHGRQGVRERGPAAKLVKQENRFGERFLGSPAHNQTIGWIKDEVRAIDGFKVRSDPFKVWRWLPRDERQGPARARPRARRRADA